MFTASGLTHAQCEISGTGCTFVRPYPGLLLNWGRVFFWPPPCSSSAPTSVPLHSNWDDVAVVVSSQLCRMAYSHSTTPQTLWLLLLASLTVRLILTSWRLLEARDGIYSVISRRAGCLGIVMREWWSCLRVTRKQRSCFNHESNRTSTLTKGT